MLAASMLVTGAITAGAQTPVYAASSSAAADTATDASLARLIESAGARGIPAEPLVAKVREGRLKRAATPRIRTALSALVTRLDSARAALGSSASVDELIAGADALAAGADGSALRALRAASAGRPVSASLGALAQLVASGVPSPRAVLMVVELLRRNASPAQVLAFGNLVESDVVSGLPAEESAALRLHSFGVDARAVLGVTDAPVSTPGSLSGSTPTPRSATPKRRP
jgi:hypothetical protein